MIKKCDTSDMKFNSAIVRSIMLTLLILIFPVASGVLISIKGIKGSSIQFIQGSFILAGGIIGVLIAKKMNKGKPMNFFGMPKVSLKLTIMVIIIMLSELLPMISGLRQDQKPSDVMNFLFFASAVAFSEELYFRGIIYDLFKKAEKRESLLKPAIYSSLLFASGHILNILSGAGLLNTFFQMILAFMFGLLAVLIRETSGSLLILFLWHLAHNLISKFAILNSAESEVIIGTLQFVIYLLCFIFLLKILKPDYKEFRKTIT